MQVCMPLCMCTKSLLQCQCAHIWYVTKQIWMPRSRYQQHSHNVTWTYRTNIFAYTCQNISYCNICFTSDYHIWACNKYASQILYICYRCKLVHGYMNRNVSINTSYEPTAIDNVTRSTGIHTFHITDICLWTMCLPQCTNMSPICLLECTFRPNTTAHIS